MIKHRKIERRDLKKLTQIGERLAAHLADLGTMEAQLQKNCALALTEALLCGDSLNKAKAILGPTEFEAMLKVNCKNVDPAKARDYMKLAKLDLSNPKMMRRGLKLAGLGQVKELVLDTKMLHMTNFC